MLKKAKEEDTCLTWLPSELLLCLSKHPVLPWLIPGKANPACEVLPREPVGQWWCPFIAAGRVTPSRSALHAAHCLHPRGLPGLFQEYHSPWFKKKPHTVNHRIKPLKWENTIPHSFHDTESNKITFNTEFPFKIVKITYRSSKETLFQ